jgi:methionyl-tRNA synthetase
VRDRCITRDLNWGVPVDRPGFEGKVFYVWFDAPIAYISTTKTWGEEDPENRDWKTWWTEGNDVAYYQFMAKDNIPFHTISFPATEIGSREPWKKVDQLKGFNWLTYYGGKFSTSQKRGIFTDQALEEEPADFWRYWLMANAPESGDSVFTVDRFAEQCNKDLAHTLGNFVNRGMKFCEKNFGAEVPSGGDWTEEEHAMAKELAALVADYTKQMEAMEFRKAMASLRAIWSLGNNYLASAAPWVAIKTNRDRAATIIRTALNLTRLFAVLAFPVIPDSATRMLAAVGHAPDGDESPTWPGQDIEGELTVLEPGEPFTTVPPLFKVIDEDRVAELTERYGGAPEEA